MSFYLISISKPNARKNYGCIWCGENIPKGENHQKEISEYNGDFQSHRFHLECADAATDYFHETKEDEFFPGGFKRGTFEPR